MGKEDIDRWLELIQELNVSEATQIMNVIASGVHANPHCEKVSHFIHLVYRMDEGEIYQGLAALARLVPRPKSKFVQFIDLARELPPEDIDRGLAALDRCRKTKLELFTDLAKELSLDAIAAGLHHAGPEKSLDAVAKQMAHEMAHQLARLTPHERKLQELALGKEQAKLVKLNLQRKQVKQQGSAPSTEIPQAPEQEKLVLVKVNLQRKQVKQQRSSPSPETPQAPEQEKSVKVNLQRKQQKSATSPEKSQFPDRKKQKREYDYARRQILKSTGSKNLTEYKKNGGTTTMSDTLGSTGAKERPPAKERTAAMLRKNKQQRVKYRAKKLAEAQALKKEEQNEDTSTESDTPGFPRAASSQHRELRTPVLGTFSGNSFGPNGAATMMHTGQSAFGPAPYPYKATFKHEMGEDDEEAYDPGETTDEEDFRGLGVKKE